MKLYLETIREGIKSYQSNHENKVAYLDESENMKYSAHADGGPRS